MPDDPVEAAKEDAKDGFYQTIKRRLGNSLVFGFVFSWLVVNWRVVFYALDPKTTASIKIDLITIYLHSIHYALWIGPLLLAIAWAFALPLLSVITDAFSELMENLRRIIVLYFVKNRRHNDEDFDKLSKYNLQILIELQNAQARHAVAMERSEQTSSKIINVQKEQVNQKDNRVNELIKQQEIYQRDLHEYDMAKKATSDSWEERSENVQNKIIQDELDQLPRGELQSKMVVAKSLLNINSCPEERLERFVELGFLVKISSKYLITPKGASVICLGLESMNRLPLR